MRERKEEIARIATIESGKVLGETRVEVAMSANILEWYAEEGRRAYGRVLPQRAPGTRLTIVKEPVGPVAAFAPWNFPLGNPARKIGAALGAGCSCILKPAEETPASGLAVARCLVDAGLPANVLAIVYGVPNDISTYLLASPIIRKISFTGSIPVGKHLMKLAADGMKRTTMELGGHAPVLVFDEVDANVGGEIGRVVGEKMAADPQLSSLWNSRMASAVEMLRAGSEYLGGEIDIVSDGQRAPVMLAEQKRAGFDEFLRKQGIPLKVVSRGDLLLFGPEPGAVEAAAGQIDSGFSSTPFYARIAESYREGAGLLLWGDLAHQQTPIPGARYIFAEQKQADGHMVASASLGFDGPRTGMAAQLAEPSPMGSLDYVSPDALAVLGFVLKDPGSMVDAVLAIPQGSFAAAQKALADERQQKGFDVRADLAASLGGEFAVALDGPLMPVPSWKLVSEVYDPGRFQATLQRFVDVHNQEIAKTGKKPLRTAQETFDGRTYYSIAEADSGPLMEAHYTFDQGYLIAGPTRALVARALQMKVAGTSIKHSSKFLELTPRDQHVNFSAVVYQNLGTSMAPLAALAGALLPHAGGGRGMPFQNLNDIKPTLYAVYGEPDRITMSADGDVLGSTLASLLSGNIRGVAGIGLPLGQMMGTHAPRAAYPGR